jgi:anti-sigma regulatory factor (Ser/Thr protein kinase)
VRRQRIAPTSPLGVTASVQLPAHARSAGRARAFLGEFCVSAGLPGEVRRTASLLVSELVTNAIVHGRCGPTVDVVLQDGVLRVAVSDVWPVPLPAVDLHPRTSAEGGRGLLIVSLLAGRWGVEPMADEGKTVWFELDT